ncbi:MAG: hypothetical protein RLZZ299_2594 [Pseudomonadota bacterium]|jgi:uncharacterized membrane protein
MRHPLPLRALAAAFLTSAAVMLVLDLTFLGVVAVDLYARHLGALKADPVVVPAAAAFYVLYLALVTRLAVVPATSTADAARRGAELGLLAYGTYELTNWAVIAGWPAALVPVDLAWGVVLTALVAAAGFAAARRVSGPA